MTENGAAKTQYPKYTLIQILLSLFSDRNKYDR